MGIFSRNLQRKTFLVTSLIIGILVSVLFVFDYTSDKKILYQRQVVRMIENSFTIRNSIESVRIPLLFQSILEEYADNILEHRDTHERDIHDQFEMSPHEIHVVNTESIVMASTNPELIGLSLEDAIQHREDGFQDVLYGRKSYSVDQMEHLGVKVLDVSVPIRDSGKIIGALHYVEPYMKLEKLIRDSLFRHILFGFMLIISLSAVINLFLTKVVSNPIKALSRAMDGLRLKGQSNEIEITSKDEIGLLEQSFNEMSRALKQREDELQRYTESLQEMVDERTKELKESNEQLVQTERLASMGKLAGYVSHEINNPIGIIVSRTECILLDAQEKGYPDFLLKDIKVIKKHANRIAKITRGMLTFSRKSPAEFTDIDINSVIDEVLILLEKQFSDYSIELRKNIDSRMPRINGNSTQLQQVFLNILSNAIDAMPQGGKITIQSRCSNDKMVHIIISDTGDGIEKDQIGKIFEPFYTTKTESKGTGLGLSVSYGIIRDHGGLINVQSKKGEGTTFEVMLPLKKDHFVEA